mmetsp:Transcript_15419/g.25516  ORF Transcript_15419/g.25516 Transcript_15419/m.25516 type:complete len:255 (-) Transcript_15419:4704-5468(-)
MHVRSREEANLTIDSCDVHNNWSSFGDIIAVVGNEHACNCDRNVFHGHVCLCRCSYCCLLIVHVDVHRYSLGGSLYATNAAGAPIIHDNRNHVGAASLRNSFWCEVLEVGEEILHLLEVAIENKLICFVLCDVDVERVDHTAAFKAYLPEGGRHKHSELIALCLVRVYVCNLNSIVEVHTLLVVSSNGGIFYIHTRRVVDALNPYRRIPDCLIFMVGDSDLEDIVATEIRVGCVHKCGHGSLDVRDLVGVPSNE